MTDGAARLRRLAEKARRAFLEGATEEWARTNGRPPTAEELRRILARDPGDPVIRRDIPP